MSYLVLARKWRPQRFADVVGQEIIVQTLSRALESGRIAHAFLLTGSRGVGKTTVARLLAKALSCETGITADPCGVCAHCKEIAAGESLDVIEIDGASNTGVDDIRELRENVRYQPSSARFKVFIIDEVHMLSTNAFNALLKTLEEPPPHVKFIFATTESHKIPITILSRCQRYDFRRMSVAVIVERLQNILRLENLSVDAEGLALIAENADGGMRDALSLLDQVLSFSGETATVQEVVSILGLIDKTTLVKATDALLEGNTKESMRFIEAASTAGYDFKQLLDGITLELRNLCLAASVGSIEGLADLSPERVKQTDERAMRYDAVDLQRVFGMAIQATDQMVGSQQPRMVVELAFLKIADRPKLAQMTEVQQALSRLESLASHAPVPVKQMPVVAPPPPKPVVTPVRAPAPTPAGEAGVWHDYVEAVAGALPVVAHHLEHGRYNSKDLIEFDQRLHFLRVQEACQLEEFQAICKQHLGVVPKVTLSESIHVAKESEEKRQQLSIEEQARNHPTVQKALEIFGGEIKAVRKA
ncbi:MAG: DNA polymerase III subunit gamma/tau [Myxococcota bacterium]